MLGTLELLARDGSAVGRPKPARVSHAATHIGRREDNQDAVLADDEARLYIVADGLGGRPGGAVASKLAVEEISRVVRRCSDTTSEDTVQLRIDLHRSPEESLLEHAVRSAHRAVIRRRDAEYAEMATTVAALHLTGGVAVIAHVGDSRIYRLRRGLLELLTRDHSLVNERHDAGDPLPPEEHETHSHIVMRALGVLRSAEPDLRCFAAQSGDTFLLCSDGLHGVLPETRIAELLGRAEPELAAERLVWSAYAANSQDNISAVVVRVP